MFIKGPLVTICGDTSSLRNCNIQFLSTFTSIKVILFCVYNSSFKSLNNNFFFFTFSQFIEKRVSQPSISQRISLYSISMLVPYDNLFKLDMFLKIQEEIEHIILASL